MERSMCLVSKIWDEFGFNLSKLRKNKIVSQI